MISVVLVTYNSMAVLQNCLRSLERSEDPGTLEMIIVDNASIDETSTYLEQYGRTATPFANVQIILLKDNRGYAYANNRGIEKAVGDLILLLNPDTEVDSDAIRRCEHLIRSTPGCGVVGCRLRLPSGNLDRACRRTFPTLWNSVTRLSGLSLLFPRSRLFARYNLTYLDDQGIYPVDAVSGAFLMMTRSVNEQVGGFDEDYFMYGEDLDLCYRIKQAGFSVWYDGEVQTLHVKGANGGKQSAVSLRYFYSTMVMYFKKHHAKNYSPVVGWLVERAVAFFFILHLSWRRLRGLL